MKKRSEAAAWTPPEEKPLQGVKHSVPAGVDPETGEVLETLGMGVCAVERPMARGVAAMSPEFDRIIESVQVHDPHATYQKLESALRMGEHRSDHGTVTKALDEAESNARTAHRLWVTAKIERERWQLDNELVEAAMRAEANRVLQDEKDQKIRNKTITEADVRAMAATLFPDQWREAEMRRHKVKAMEESMQNLVEVWMSRCRTLQTIAMKQR